MHCHTEFHSADGMLLIVKSGEVDEMPPTPESMRRCGNWPPSNRDDIGINGMYFQMVHLRWFLILFSI